MTPDTRKKLGIILGILLFVLVVGVFTVPWLVDLNHYNAPIVSAIEKAVGGKARLGRITWGLHTGLWLEADGLSLNNGSGILGVVKLKRVHATVALLPLLAKKIVIKNLVLDMPEVELNLTAAKTQGSGNTDRPIPSTQANGQRAETDASGQPAAESSHDAAHSQSSDISASKPLKILITGLTAKQGRLKVTDTLTLPDLPIVRTFTDVTLRAGHSVTEKEVTFSLSLRDEEENGLGSLAAKGTFTGLTEQFTIENPQLTVNAAIKDNNVAAFKPYLKNDQLTERLGGSVSLEIDYSGSFSPTGQATGTIDLTHLTYTDRSLWDTPLPGAATKLIFAATFTPDELVVDKANLTVGKITVDGRSRLENWKAAPIFKDIVVSGDFPLADLTPLLPWKQMGKHADLLKDILAGSGEIKVAKASLAELDPDKLPADKAALWTEVELAAEISAVSIKPTQTLPKVPKAENITAAIRLAGGVIDIDQLTAEIAAISLPKISAQITQLPHQPLINLKLYGPIRLADIDDDSLRNLLRGFGFEKLALTGNIDLAVQLETARPEQFSIEGTAGVQDGLVKTAYSPVVLQNLNAEVTLASDTANISNLAATVLLPAGNGSPENAVNLTLQAQLTNLNRRPSLNLQNLKTSPVSLPVLAAVIPWEQFSGAPIIVKDVLHDGGTIEINHLSLPTIDLAEPFNDPDKLLSAAKVSMSLAGVTVRPVASLPAIEGITGHPSLEKGVLTTSDLKARIGPLTTPTMNIRVTHLSGLPKIQATAKGPMRVAATDNVTVEKFLEKYGLKSFNGNADVDFNLFYDHANPAQWSAKGLATLEEIQAVTSPAEVRLKNLQGRISFVKEKLRELAFGNLSAEINAASIRLNGKISGKSAADLAVDLKAETRQLDLAAMSELVPGIKDLGLSGKIDLDMEIVLPYEAPLQSRLTGSLKTDQLALHLKEAAVKFEDINSDLNFTGRSATINRLTLRLNEQRLTATGQLSHPEEPAVDLVITSPDLNIDRLLFAKDSQEKPSEPRQDSQQGDTAEEPKRKEDKATASGEPRFLHLSSANIRIEAQKGHFRGQDVEDMRITADYEKGLIKNYAIDFNSGGGHAAARGMVDMRHPDHVAFTVDPEIQNVPLKTIASLLGIDETSTEGPLSISGQLKARTGSTRELLASLDGNLDAEIGSGRITIGDSLGKSLAKMLQFMSIRNLLSGNLKGRLEGDGLSFNSAKVTATFEGGQVNISTLEYNSDSFTAEAAGTVDLPGHQLNVGSKLAVFDTVGKAMKLVPIVGSAADAVSSLYFTVDGSLDDPRVRINPAGGVVQGAEDILTAPDRAIKDLMEFGKE